MELSVKFRSEKSTAVYILSRYTNLKDLDFIRQKGYSNALMKNVDDSTPSFKEDITLRLTEDQARLAGHFYDQSHVNCAVDAGSLNRFVIEEVEKTSHGMFRIVLKLDEEALFKYWQESKFALEIYSN